jgi:hypothetical protein
LNPINLKSKRAEAKKTGTETCESRFSEYRSLKTAIRFGNIAIEEGQAIVRFKLHGKFDGFILQI